MSKMYAVKANKMYQVDDTSKKTYLAQGYDIQDEKGNVIERSPKSTVPYAEYAKVVKELEDSKSRMANMSVYELLATYAQLKNIDVGQATSEEGILKKIKDAEEKEAEE